MLNESTGLAAFAFLLSDTLKEEYGIDLGPVMKEFDISEELRHKPGARLPVDTFDALWDIALKKSGDSTLGIKVGRRATASSYYVLGHSWHASNSLGEAIERLVRYDGIIDTSEADLRFEKQGELYRLSEGYADPDLKPPPYSVDAEIAGLLMLCESVAGEPVYPVKVELMEESSPHPDAHQELFNAPVTYGAKEYALYFKAEDIERPLETAIPALAEASDNIADRYLDSLDKSKVAAQVRQLLIQMLPAGAADQENIASKMYRSSSTLQRQLTAEGTSYRDVLESTRSKLAQEYLKVGEHTHAQIAYLLGFSDQSNFARAFKRWTGQSPGQYQKAKA